MIDRRAVLRGAEAAGVVGLTGCSSRLVDRPSLTLSAENYREEAVDLLLEVVRSDAADRSEALVYRDRVRLAPGAVGDEAWRADGVAPARPYRIEAEVRSGLEASHYHYVPDCTDGDSPYRPRVNLVLNEEPGVSFGQTTCSGEVASAP